MQLWNDFTFKLMKRMLNHMEKNLDKVTEKDKKNLNFLKSMLCKTLGISEHTEWRVDWRVEKWADTARKLAGFAPDEVLMETQNIVVDTGANELLKLITGRGGTAYDEENALIYVGTDNTPENAADTGVKATGTNRAYAEMDPGYPIVTGRQMIFRASFGDTSANFEWNEASIVNGTGANAIAMNRKVANLGTKTVGTWTLQITISLTSV